MCVSVRVNPMSLCVCVCMCLVGWPPFFPLPRLINVKLGLEAERQLAHIVRDSSLVRILVVVVVVVTVTHATACRAAVEATAGIAAAQVATVRR